LGMLRIQVSASNVVRVFRGDMVGFRVHAFLGPPATRKLHTIHITLV